MFTTSHPLVVELAGPPRGKGRPRFSKFSARPHTPQATRSYEQDLGWAARTAMQGHPPLDGPISVSVIAILPVPASWAKRKRAAALTGQLRPTGKPDFDNIAKMLDAFNRIVWRDDSQIVSGRVCKMYGPDPKLRVAIASLAVGETASPSWEAA